MPSVIPWSWSSLQSFETCPWRHYLTKVSKQVVEPTTPALAEGRATHKALENGVNGEPMVGFYKKYEPIVQRVRAATGQKHAEIKFGITPSLNRTGFWDKDVWCRGVLDVAIVGPKTGVVLDWKSGKPKVDSDQLKLFSAAGFGMYPFLEKIKAGYVWLEYNRIDTETYLKEDVPVIWQEFVPRVKRMEIAQERNDWPVKPSGLCGWCPVGRDKCDHWQGYHGEHRR
jgi:hypothetical protein